MEVAQKWAASRSFSWKEGCSGVSAPDLRFTEAAALPRSAKTHGTRNNTTYRIVWWRFVVTSVLSRI